MPVYLHCPFCKTDQSVRNKICRKCGKPFPKQNKTYRVVVKVSGKVVTRIVPNSLTLAKEIEAKIKAELVSGEYYDRRQKAKEETPFSEFFEKKYLPDAENNKSEGSMVRERQLYKTYIKPLFGKKPLNKISPFDLEKLKKVMKDKGLAEHTIAYALAVVRQAFNKARLWGYYSGDNPVSKVKKPTKDNRRERFLSLEEAKALLEECKKRSRQLYEICLLALFCGLRAGEIFRLKWQDIDLNNGLIYIRDPKNRNNRVAYMPPQVKELFQSKQPGQPDELVFKNQKGEKIKTATFSKAFSCIVKALGFNDGITDPRQKVVFHTLRHTFASWLAIQGTPIYTISELMGHKTLAMTKRYSHLCPDVKREAVTRLATQAMQNKENNLKNIMDN